MQMLKKFACAVAVALIGSIALADTVRGIITAVEGEKKILVTVRKKGEKEGEKKEFSINTDTKYTKVKGKDDEEASSLSDLKAVLKKSKRGVLGSLEVTDGKATAVKFGGGRRMRMKTTE
jgi:hypothetical protein